jgi:hypothetical protein
MNNTEVITMQDKDKRDEMYHDLRKNGDELERQVVRFSESELVIPDTDDHAIRRYRQTWSVAYPRS